MGVDTDELASQVTSTERSVADDDISTVTDGASDNLSKITERTHYSLPGDGSPITIPIRRATGDGATTISQASQTSLLIEYFEGGRNNSLNPRPSVRVKVTPSSRKVRQPGDHIQITETTKDGSRPTYSQRISLSPEDRGERLIHTSHVAEAAMLGADIAKRRHRANSKGSPYASASEETRRPIDIEVGDGSPLSTIGTELGTNMAQSEVSSMPPDIPMYDSDHARKTHASKSQSRTKELAKGAAVLGAGAVAGELLGKGLGTPTRSRSKSKDRIAAKAAEKIVSERTRGLDKERRRSSKSRSSSISKEADIVSDSKSPRQRRSSRGLEESELGVEHDSTLHVRSPARMSVDQQSVRSGTSINSRTSINNPRLLEAVEDAIRRLIKPELTAIKAAQEELKLESKKKRLERGESFGSEASMEDRRRRRVARTSSSPEVGGSKVRIAHDEGLVERARRDRRSDRKSSGESISEHGRRRSHRRDGDERSLQTDTVNEKTVHKSKSREGSKLRNLLGLGTAGAVAAGVVHHEDEKHRDERRRRRHSSREGRSRSGSLSVSESADSLRHRDVPLMPPMPLLGSELNPSEVTRESLLSDSTTPHELHSPSQEVRSPHYEQYNDYDDEHYQHEDPRGMVHDRELPHERKSDSKRLVEAGLLGAGVGGIAAVAAGHLKPHGNLHSPDTELVNEHGEPYVEGRDYPSVGIRGHPRHLSPIQSVDESAEEREMYGKEPHYASKSPRDLQRESYATGDEDIWTVKKHPMEQESEVQEIDYDDLSSNESHLIDHRHMTNYTDDSMDPSNWDNLATGQAVRGVGANATMISTPNAVRSAVASLHNSSLASVTDDEHRPYSMESYQANHPDALPDSKRGFVDHVPMGASALPDLSNPDPAIGYHLGEADEESSTSTNPRAVRGPGPTIKNETIDSWPYETEPPLSSQKHGISATEAGLFGMAGAGIGAVAGDALHNHHDGLDLERHGVERELQHESQHAPLKDEAYFSAPNNNIGSLGHGSPNLLTPEPEKRARNAYDDFMNEPEDDDGFMEERYARHLSMNSDGMPSPLYDGATGRGLNRIESKDIVALMNHLTVRDAQRNARDTEILVTLVRSAAEIKMNFDDMRKFMSEQEKNIGDHTERSVSKALSGPRPQPLGTPRFPARERGSFDSIDEPVKKKNVFKRALKGLSGRSSNDLTRIEDMLNHLLTEIESLKAAQGINTSTQQSLHSFDPSHNISEGYEADAHAGTSSGGPSGFFSTAASGLGSARRGMSDHRITTVDEADEDYNSAEEDPTTPKQAQAGMATAQFHTPPLQNIMATEGKDSTPRKLKHKSNASTFLPKVSRWSETTASTIVRGFRNSKQKTRPDSLAGEEGDFWTENDPRGDKLHSTYSLEEDSPQTPRANSPVGQQRRVLDGDRPAHTANRISLDIKHPKPVPSSHGLHNHLEYQAETFSSPGSPVFERWGSNPSLPQHANRYSTGSQPRPRNMSPTSSVASQRYADSAPPLPPKILEEPLIPPEATSTTGSQTFLGRSSRSIGDGVDPILEKLNHNSKSTPTRRTSAALRDHYGLDLDSSNSTSNSPNGSRADLLLAETKGLSPPPTLQAIHVMTRGDVQSTGVRKPSGPRPFSGSGRRSRNSTSTEPEQERKWKRDTFGVNAVSDRMVPRTEWGM